MMRTEGSGAGVRRRLQRGVALTAFVVVALVAAACGSSSSDDGTTASAGTGAGTAPASTTASTATQGCGSVPKLPIKDESGVIKTLPEQYQASYSGYPLTIQKSAWADFKPKGPPPYSVGLMFPDPVNTLAAAYYPELVKQLKSNPDIGDVTLLNASPQSLTAQIQKANQLIQRKVDVLVTQSISGPAFASVADRAAKAGIPLVSILISVPSPNAISLGFSAVADGARTGAQLANLIGKRGTVVGMHGFPGVEADTQMFSGWKAAFAKCPDIKFDDSLAGLYQLPVAKAKMQSYLSSHPQPIAGAVEPGGMAGGIIQAFEQAGRKVPPLVSMGATVGTLAYWSDHKDSYTAIPLPIPSQDLANATTSVVNRLLAGKGPKVTAIMQNAPEVTAETLPQWVKPGTKVSDPANAEGPPNSWLSDEYLNPLFNG